MGRDEGGVGGGGGSGTGGFYVNPKPSTLFRVWRLELSGLRGFAVEVSSGQSVEG